MTRRLVFIFFLTFVLTLALAGSLAAFVSAEKGAAEHELIRFSPEELDEFGITTATAGQGIIERYLELAGEVQPNADLLAHIVPRYSGIVTEVRAAIGDYLKQGQVLAIVESDESLAPFEVTTLISGTIIDKHVALGEAVSREREIFVIADLSSVWIDLMVYQNDLDTITTGRKATIYVGHDATRDGGIISYVTPIVDEQTRTATARVVLSNEKHYWRPGMFVTAKVLIESVRVPLSVPRSAINILEEETVVFVDTGEGFRPQAVTLGRGSKSHVEILSGLSVGDRYVDHGGFTLKAELGKEALGDDHGH